MKLEGAREGKEFGGHCARDETGENVPWETRPQQHRLCEVTWSPFGRECEKCLRKLVLEGREDLGEDVRDEGESGDLEERMK